MNYLTDYYETHDEDGRLSLSKHGQVGNHVLDVLRV